MNEAPVISTLDGNDTGIIDHVENLTAVIDVNVTHEENATQSVSFSIIGGADQSKFDINSSTGQLVFRNAPDFENPQDADLDTNKTYEKLLDDTIEGLQEFISDVKEKKFPTPSNIVEIKDEEFEKFLNKIN